MLQPTFKGPTLYPARKTDLPSRAACDGRGAFGRSRRSLSFRLGWRLRVMCKK